MNGIPRVASRRRPSGRLRIRTVFRQGSHSASLLDQPPRGHRPRWLRPGSRSGIPSIERRFEVVFCRTWKVVRHLPVEVRQNHLPACSPLHISKLIPNAPLWRYNREGEGKAKRRPQPYRRMGFQSIFRIDLYSVNAVWKHLRISRTPRARHHATSPNNGASFAGGNFAPKFKALCS